MNLPAALKNRTILLTTLAIGLFVLLLPEYTHAGWFDWIPGASFSIAGFVGKFFYLIATVFGGAVLYLGSLVLDYSVYFLVIQMGTFFQSNAWFGQAVTLGWTLIRDLINMTFIFGLIYIGIKTILNSESADTRRQLIYLIFAALLINFSLFFTQLVVDFTNLLATQMYTQLSSSSQTGEIPSFTTAFLRASGVSSFISTGSIRQDNTKEPAIEGGALIVYSIMLGIFYILAGISFLMGSIMIVTRFVALTLYMIFSPVMFLGWILPQFKSYASTWWEGFWKYCIFAPIYLFLLYISLQVLTGLTSGGSVLATTGNSKSLEVIAKATEEAQTTTGQIIIGFMIMIGLLWASMKIGEKLSISGSKMAMGGFNGAIRGASAMVYRNTAGRAANWARDTYDEINARKDGALDKRGGRVFRRALTKTRDYGALGGRSLEASDKLKTDAASVVDKTQRRQFLLDKDLSNISKASGAELTGFVDDDSTKKQILNKAGNLSATQMKSLLDSDKLTDKEKEELKKNNKEQLVAVAKTPAGMEKLLKGKKPSDIANLPKEILKDRNAAKYLVDTGVLSKLAESESLSKDDRREIAANVRHATEDMSVDEMETLDKWFSTDRLAQRFKG